jgi:hypothetical protein
MERVEGAVNEQELAILTVCPHGYKSIVHCPQCGRGMGILNENGHVTGCSLGDDDKCVTFCPKCGTLNLYRTLDGGRECIDCGYARSGKGGN